MSQFNPTNDQKENESERKNRPIIYWVIIVLLVCACLVMFVRNNKMASENAAVQKHLMAQIDSVKTDRASLQSDFDAASAKIDQLVSQNSKLDSNLQKDKSEILALQNKIRSIMGNSSASKEDLKKARALITDLTDKTTHYEARIAELEKENTMLTNKNIVLGRERDSTVTQNIAIKRIASVLHASNMRMEPLHIRKNGHEKETSKAKKVDVLRIMFDIDENRVAESGPKKVYLRLVAPDGAVLSSSANGSGMMTNAKGDQISYSLMKEINLVKEQPVKDVSVDWHQDGNYDKGVYLIEIFSEGYKVGSGNVTLK